MDRIKALFITTFISVAVFLTYHGIAMGFWVGYDAAWFLLGLSAGVVPSYFIRIYLWPIARNSKDLLGWSVAVLIFGLTSFILNGITGSYYRALDVLWVIPLIGWLLYVYWYSVIPRSLSRLKGVKLPEKAFTSLEGELVPNSYFHGKKSILVFYRGNWCPFCMAQIRELEDRIADFSQKGYQLYLISPQPLSYSNKLSDRFGSGIIFLHDEGSQVAQELGILHKAGTPFGLEIFGYKSKTVKPAIMVLDEIGQIVYSEIANNYRQRPVPSDLLDVLDNLGKTKELALT